MLLLSMVTNRINTTETITLTFKANMIQQMFRQNQSAIRIKINMVEKAVLGVMESSFDVLMQFLYPTFFFLFLSFS